MAKSAVEEVVDVRRSGTPGAPVILIVGSAGPLAEQLSIELLHVAEIRTATSIREAMDATDHVPPSLLVVSEGVVDNEPSAKLRFLANRWGTPIILLLEDEHSRPLALEVGAADYFASPFEPRVLAHRLRSMIECREQNRREATLHEARWRFALEGASLGIWEHDLKAKMVTCSAAFCDILGIRTGEPSFDEDTWLSLVHPLDRTRVKDARRRLRDGIQEEAKLEYRIAASESRVVWVREVVRVLQKEAHKPVRLMGVVTDTTQQRASERRIVQLANFDLLTELPNRKKCLEFLLEAVERAQSTGDAACLVRIDISGLASINQTKGRPAGDFVLQQVAERLRESASNPDRVCRLGGKEFALIIEQIPRSNERARAAEIAATVAQAISEPLEIRGDLISCGAHTGACLFPEEGTDPEELLRRADIALADATHDRLSFAVFRKSMLKRVEARQRLLRELQHAVFSGEIGLAYQPIVEGTGKLVGVEALARWQHPTRGRIPAAEFIPLAIETGLIVPLGAALRRIACHQLAKWSRNPSTRQLLLSLNVSPMEFATDSFANDLVLLVESMGVDPEKLQLELSESLLRRDPDIVGERMQTLSKAGIRLALDDFGTGYSSLILLKKLPFDHLKLDRSFVSEILTDPVDASLSRAILAMAQNLGLEVIAEGVEEETQMRLLTEMGCTRFQGYLFGRPTDAQTIESRAAEEHSPVSQAIPSITTPPSRTFEDEMDAHILIVDDDSTTLQLLGRILRDYPNVRTTTSPLQALKMVQGRPPDLLLLDTQMPELNGFELLDALRHNSALADVPAVFVTALLDPETEIRALAMGAVDFVSKPISAARLKLAVRNQVRIKRQTDSLRQQASLDALTGVANRRSFDRALDREWARSIEGKSPLSLLMIDVDHFKFINDNFGHTAGDRCLISIARILADVVRRPVDLVARYGGEEFAVILALTEGEQAEKIAKKLVYEVQTTNFSVDLNASHEVTISIGWDTMDGTAPPGNKDGPRGMLQRADEALLLAKEQGRNRVCGPEALSRRLRSV